MEVSILPENSLKLKSKHSVFLVNPTGKIADANALLFLSSGHKAADDFVVIDGPGEYEIGGVKVSGIKAGEDSVYSLLLDGVDVMIGKLSAIEKIQHKAKEHSMVVISADELAQTDAAFITGLATSILVAFGNNGKTIIGSFGKGEPQVMNKVVVTKDKLPVEMQTILLANN